MFILTTSGRLILIFTVHTFAEFHCIDGDLVNRSTATDEQTTLSILIFIHSLPSTSTSSGLSLFLYSPYVCGRVGPAMPLI